MGFWHSGRERMGWDGLTSGVAQRTVGSGEVDHPSQKKSSLAVSRESWGAGRGGLRWETPGASDSFVTSLAHTTNTQTPIVMDASPTLWIQSEPQYRGTSPQRPGHVWKICAPKAVLRRQHPRPEQRLIHRCQSQIYNLSGDERTWSSNGGLAEPQS